MSEDKQENKESIVPAFVFAVSIIGGAWWVFSGDNEQVVEENQFNDAILQDEAPCFGNKECLAHERAIVIINRADNLQSTDPKMADFLRDIGISSIAPSNSEFGEALQEIQQKGCTSSNPMDRFRPNCGMN
jgi:hypothetical protein